MGWFKITDRNAYSTFFSFGSSGGDGHVLQTNTTGTAVVVWDGLSENSTGFSVVDGVWAHLAFVCGTSTITPYLNGVAGTGFAGSAASIGTRTSILIGESHGGGEWLNAAVAAVKFYSVALTAAEIQQEMRQYLPARTLNLTGFYPILSLVDDQVDYSGAGLTLTPAGTLSAEDGPPIPWKTGRHRRIYVPAGGGGGGQDAAGALALGAATLAASVTVERAVSAALTLNGPDLAAALAVERTVAGTLTIAPLTLAASVARDVSVSSAITLPGVDLAAVVAVARDASGALVLVVPVLAADVVGDEKTVSAALVIPAPVLAADVDVERSVSGALNLRALVLDGDILREVNVSAALVIDAPTLAAQVAIERLVSGALTLPEAVLAAQVISGAVQSLIGTRATVRVIGGRQATVTDISKGSSVTDLTKRGTVN